MKKHKINIKCQDLTKDDSPSAFTSTFILPPLMVSNAAVSDPMSVSVHERRCHGPDWCN